MANEHTRIVQINGGPGGGGGPFTVAQAANGDLTITDTGSANTILLPETMFPNIYQNDGALNGNRTVTLATNDLIFDNAAGGDFRITGKLTVDGLIDPTGLQFTDGVNQSDAAMPNTTVYVTDGTLSGIPAGELIFKDAAGNYHQLENTIGGANTRAFGDDTTMAPATAGQPTAAEAQAFAAAATLTDTILYYTGTDVAADPVTYVWHIDAAGVATEIANPSSATTFGQYQGQWDPSLGAAPAATAARDWFLVSGTASTVPALGGTTTYNPGDLVIALSTPVLGDAQLQVVPITTAAAAANNRVHADDTTVAPATAGAPTEAELQAFATGAGVTDSLVYYTGDDLPASAATYVALVDGAGTATMIEVPAAGGGGILTADLVQTANRTQDFGGFNQAWNNIGRLEALAADHIRFEATNGPATPFMQVDNVIPDARIGTVDADSTALVTAGTTNATMFFQQGADITNFEVAAGGVSIQFPAAGDLELNADPGTAGQVLTSQGPNVPPVWTSPAGGTFGQFAGTWDPSLGAAPAATNGNDWFLINGTAATVPALGGGVTYTPGDLVVALGAPVLADAQLQVIPIGGGGGGSILEGAITQTGTYTHDQATNSLIFNNIGQWSWNGANTDVLFSDIGSGQIRMTVDDTTEGRIEVRHNQVFMQYTDAVFRQAEFRLEENGAGLPVAMIRTQDVFNAVATNGMVLTLVDAATGEVEWAAAGGGGNVIDSDLTQTANRTQDLGGFNQFWNNAGIMQITAATNASLIATAGGALGHGVAADTTTGDARIYTTDGTDTGLIFASLTQVQMQFDDGGAASTIDIDAAGIELNFHAGADLEVDGLPGAVGEVLTSQGDGLPPVWAAPGAVANPVLEHVLFRTTTNVDDPSGNTLLQLEETQTISGTLAVANGSTTVVLPQSTIPYHLEAFFEFDTDNQNDDAVEIEWTDAAGNAIGAMSSRAYLVPDPADGSNDEEGIEAIGIRAFALVDASAGPVTIALEVTDGSGNVDIQEINGSIRQWSTNATASSATVVIPDLTIVDQAAPYNVDATDFTVETYHRLTAPAAIPTLQPIAATEVGKVLHISNVATGGAITVATAGGVTANLLPTIENNDTVTVVVVGVNEYDVIGGI